MAWPIPQSRIDADLIPKFGIVVVFFLHDKTLVFWPTEASLWAYIHRLIQATTLPLWRRDESWQPTQCHTLVPPKYSRLNWSETTAGFWKCAGHWKRPFQNESPVKEALHTGPQAVSRCQSTHQLIRKRPVQNREQPGVNDSSPQVPTHTMTRRMVEEG